GDFSAGDCASATGLNSVTYALLDESTTPATLLAEQNDGACVDSLMFQMPEVTFDGTKNYTLQIHGGPNAAATYWEAECTGLMADDTGLHIETCFVDDVRPRMKVGLSWDADATEDFSGAGCATAGVSKITVKLRKSGAVSTVASYPNISCADSITFTAPEVELGTNYELEVTGGATDNATDWASTCTGLSAAAGAPMEWTCEIQHTAL
ncbi:MAG: hypothetical protein KC417_14400, partial [Myxococcales bacterium]|nr:hypothetical protein [Myxococcales bacterium]